MTTTAILNAGLAGFITSLEAELSELADQQEAIYTASHARHAEGGLLEFTADEKTADDDLTATIEEREAVLAEAAPSRSGSRRFGSLTSPARTARASTARPDPPRPAARSAPPASRATSTLR